MKLKNLLPVLLFIGIMPLRILAGEYFDQDTLDFGEVTAGSTSTMKIGLTNPEQNVPMEIIEDIGVWKYDGVEIVLPQDKNIPPGSSKQIEIKFTPKQNMAYKTKVFITCRQGKSFFTVPLVVSASAKLTNKSYSFTYDLERSGLLESLFDFMKGQTVLSYSDAREAMYANVDNIDGVVECIYTASKFETQHRPVDDSYFNTEHVWPQSKGAGNAPEKTDIHHIYPTLTIANSKRASYPFDFIKGSPTWQQGGSKLGSDGEGHTVFEVRDEKKGDIARSMLYFAARYGNESNVEIEYIFPQEDLLKEWSRLDPPDDYEKQRNDRIEQAQNNRNPFIDVPALMERISFQPQVEQGNLIVINDSLVFDLTNTNESDEASVYVYNSGNTIINIFGVSINPQNNEYFSAELIDKSAAPGEYAEIRITAHPGDYIQTIASMNIITDGINQPAGLMLKAYNSPVSVREKPFLSKVSLHQNIPNPVESLSEIKFTVPKKMQKNCNLKFFNLLGEEIADLTRAVMWNGNEGSCIVNVGDLKPAGNVFYYRLNVEGYSITNMMIVD